MLALCGLPQAIRSYIDGHSDGISWGFVLTWFMGCILMLIYVFPSGSMPLIVDYMLNICFTTIIIYYKVKK